MRFFISSKIIFSTLAITLLSSCGIAQTHKLQPDDLDLPTRKLDNSKIKRDVELLIYALDKAYPPARRGQIEKYQELRNKLINISKTSAVLTGTQLCRKIDDAFSEFPDNHLQAVAGGQACSLLRKEGVGSVGSNAGTKDAVWSRQDLKIKSKKVPLVSIQKCPLKNDPKWNGLLDEITKIKNTAPALILDLRGNQGGDSSMGTKVAEILYGGPVPDLRNSFTVQSTEAIQLERNSFQSKASKEFLSTGDIPLHLSKRLEEIELKILRSKNHELPETIEFHIGEAPQFNPAAGFNKPIYILQDRECASSCEALLEDLEKHPHAVTVGENTAGSIHFGNVRNLVLPASGIVIQVPTKSFEYPDKRFNEKIGYAPRVKIKSGGDALTWVKRNLKFNSASPNITP